MKMQTRQTKTQTTIRSRTAAAPRAIPALLAGVLVLGGCSATHVDDAWQCPLAQGTACTSVAEADPAVAPSGKAQGLAPFSEFPQPETGAAGETGEACVRDCDPLAWIAEWLGIEEEPDDGAAPAELEAASESDGTPEESGGGLRTKERIARIWIAPFVDAGGVYREGHWVRTVVEPARWRRR